MTKIDERALEAASQAFLDRVKFGGEIKVREFLTDAILAYNDALSVPPSEPGRDRIAVARFFDGGAVCAFVQDGEEPEWGMLEAVVDMEAGCAARYIVRANCPPPAELEPVEVEGSVGVVEDDPNGDEVRG